MTDHCHTCQRPIVGYDSVHCGSIETGYRDLCSRCFNEEVADRDELDFQHVQIDPVCQHLDEADLRSSEDPT